MEHYVSVIKNLFFSWYQFSLENPGYPGAIALMAGLAVALMMLTSHRTKLGKLKRKFEANNFVREQEHLKINYQLDNVQQQLHQTQEQLVDKDKQLAQVIKDNQVSQALAAHSIAELETQIYQHNKDMAHVVQNLEADFGMEQQSTLVSDGLDSSVLWQRHADVLKQLGERLQGHQKIVAELQQNQQTLVGQLSGKSAVIQELQETLESQNRHISQLTRDLQTQKDQAQQAIQKLISEFEVKGKNKPSAMLGDDMSKLEVVPKFVQSAAVVELNPQARVDTVYERQATVLESVQEPYGVEAQGSVEGDVSISQGSIEEMPLVEKKSWLSPLKKQFEVLTSKAKSSSEQQLETVEMAVAEPKAEFADTGLLSEEPVVETMPETLELSETLNNTVIEDVEVQLLPEKTSWFSPIKSRLKALTGKATPASKAQGELNAVEPVVVLADSTLVEAVQEIHVVELASAIPETKEGVADNKIDVVEDPLHKKKSWFSPIKAQFDAVTGKDKYYG